MTPIQKMRVIADAQALLGVTQSTSMEQLHVAWRKAMFKAHPDRGGSNDQVHRVNAAYALLRDRTTDNAEAMVQAKSTVRPKRPTTVIRPRPRAVSRTTELCPDARAYCKSVVGEAGGGHIPTRVEREGRAVSYIIEGPLKKGVNHVALPTGYLVDGKDGVPTLVSFRAENDGKGRIVVPDRVRSERFPGASRVELHFTQERA